MEKPETKARIPCGPLKGQSIFDLFAVRSQCLEFCVSDAGGGTKAGRPISHGNAE